MARPGVTYQDIASAANQLKGEGKSITIENVRAILGTGSIGTINNHLRKWKEAESTTHKIASKENLPESLIGLIKGLWEGVVTQSSAQFVSIEENYQREISELKDELEKYKNNNQRWQKLFNQWQQEKAQLANEKLTLEQALEFAQTENHSLHSKQDSLLQQLQEKRERIEELHRLHKQAQDNLEHYRESAREQRLLDQQQFEQQKQQLQLEIKVLNEQLSIQREKGLAGQQQNHLLQQTIATLEKEHIENRSTLEILRVQYEEVGKAKNEYFQSSQHWQNQFKKMQLMLNEKNNQLIDIQAENKLLSQEKIHAQQAFTDIQDQNKLLNHDRWVLGQEKAQLEGQLKQMQKMITA